MRALSHMSRNSFEKLFFEPLQHVSIRHVHSHGRASKTYLVATTTLSLVQDAVMPCVKSRRKEPTTASTSSSVLPKKGNTAVISTLPLDRR